MFLPSLKFLCFAQFFFAVLMFILNYLTRLKNLNLALMCFYGGFTSILQR